MRGILTGLLLVLLMGCTPPFYEPDEVSLPRERWIWQNCTSTGVDLYGVCAVDSLRLWAVGDEETVIRSTDGGITWDEQLHEYYPGYDFKLVQFFNAEVGWVMGSGIYRTIDGGAHWDWQHNPSGEYIYGMAPVHRLLCYAVTYGGAIMKTEDGGDNWRIIADLNRWLSSVSFVNSENGWVTTSDSIFHTTDGGATWTAHYTGIASGPVTCAFVDQNHGWVGSYNEIGYTTDGGVTWSVNSSMPSGSNYPRLIARGPTEAWMAGSYLLHTTDGTTWHQQDLAPLSSYSAYAINFSDPDRAWIVGYGGRIGRSEDGGQTWREMSNSDHVQPTSLDFVDDRHGWLVGGYGEIEHTTNGGASWQRQQSTDSTHLVAVDFVDADYGWVVGFNGTILSTTDGGNHWQRLTTSATEWLEEVAFADRFTGWVAGFRGNGTSLVYQTTDGGLTWSEQQIPTTRTVRGLTCVDPLHAWAAVEDAAILRTTDGGRQWISTPLPSRNVTTRDIAFVDRMNGMVAVQSSSSDYSDPGIFRTTDGGETWTVSADRSKFYSLSMVDAGHGYAIGYGYYPNQGTFFRYSGVWMTADHGIHWEPFSRYSGNALKFVSTRSGWMLSNGGIRHYSYQ
jgi:photosystem II stability/assembly factor-like uncharacterized protein